MKFDDVIRELGEFGPYQMKIYFLVCLVAIPCGIQTLAGVFTTAIPSHRCALPSLPNDTYESQGTWHDDLIRANIPWDDDEDDYSFCKLYRPDGSNKTMSCDKWVYSTDPFDNTFVSEENLVCDDKELVTYASMILMSGLLAGSLVMGALSDMIGRKKVLIGCCICHFGTGLGTAFMTTYAGFVAFRFLTMFFGIGMFLSAFVIGMEIVGPKKRKIAGIVIEMFWCFGLFMQTGIAYGLKDWSNFQIAISVPAILVFFLFVWQLPESTRWLINKGKYEEATEIIKKAAKGNGVELSEKALNLQDIESEGKEEKIWHMFMSPVLVIRSLVIFFNWLVASMVYYGLSLNVGSLSGDIYLNFFLSALVELSSYIFCLIFLDKAGRKPLQCFSMLLSGIACIGTMFPVIWGGDDVKWVTVVLSLVGKFGASAGFAVIFVFSAELFPTVLRNSGMGLSSFSARIGGIMAPYIAALGDMIDGHFGVALPLIIFGGLSVAAGFLALMLPETAHKILPDSVEDARKFGKKKLAAYEMTVTANGEQVKEKNGATNLSFVQTE